VNIKRNIAAIAILALCMFAISKPANAQNLKACKAAIGTWIYTVTMDNQPTVHGVERYSADGGYLATDVIAGSFKTTGIQLDLYRQQHLGVELHHTAL
jgi:hypothetical protein